MAQLDERTVRDRIERLRRRLDLATNFLELRNIIKGILDLLEDEL
jgi:hypothetical protein